MPVHVPELAMLQYSAVHQQLVNPTKAGAIARYTSSIPQGALEAQRMVYECVGPDWQCSNTVQYGTEAHLCIARPFQDDPAEPVLCVPKIAKLQYKDQNKH